METRLLARQTMKNLAVHYQQLRILPQNTIGIEIVFKRAVLLELGVFLVS